MTQYVEVTRENHVLEVKLNKPKVNAIDHAMSRELGNAFKLLREDPALRVAILTAEGDRIFSAGWDLKLSWDEIVVALFISKRRWRICE